MRGSKRLRTAQSVEFGVGSAEDVHHAPRHQFLVPLRLREPPSNLVDLPRCINVADVHLIGADTDDWS